MINEKYVVVRKDSEDIDCDSMLACSFKDKREAVSYALSRLAVEVVKLYDEFQPYEAVIQDDLYTIVDLDRKIKIQYTILSDEEFKDWNNLSWEILSVYEPSKFTTVNTTYLDNRFQKKN